MLLGCKNYALCISSLTRLSLSMAALSRTIQLWYTNTTHICICAAFLSHYPYITMHTGLTWYRFRLFPFRSPLLRKSLCFLFLALLRCFSSCRSPSYPMNSDKNTLTLIRVDFSIRKPSDQCLIDSSPKFLAVFRLLHRLLMPRHPPKALFN